MRIHIQPINSKEPVFGALRFTITEFLGEGKINNASVLFFRTKEHGIAYCNIIMAERIRERLAINRLSTKIIDEALTSQPLFKK